MLFDPKNYRQVGIIMPGSGLNFAFAIAEARTRGFLVLTRLAGHAELYRP